MPNESQAGGSDLDQVVEDGAKTTETTKTKTTKPEAKQGEVSIDKILKENELLKSNVSALQKQNNQILTGLKSIFGGGESSEGQKPEEVINQLQTRLSTLEAEANKGKAESLKNNYIANLADEDGKPLDPKVKDYLRLEVQVDKPDDEIIRQAVSSKLTTLKSLLGDRLTARASDDSPERSNRSMSSANPTANEILAKHGKK